MMTKKQKQSLIRRHQLLQWYIPVVALLRPLPVVLLVRVVPLLPLPVGALLEAVVLLLLLAVIVLFLFGAEVEAARSRRRTKQGECIWYDQASLRTPSNTSCGAWSRPQTPTWDGRRQDRSRT